MKVGIFDSGLGGLTVLKELLKVHPNNEYIYFGDTYNLPYGNKSKEELLVYSDKIIKFLKEKKVELIILACGTISSNVYFEVKDKYHIPIIDVLGPTVNYLLNCQYKKVGVIGTEMLIKSQYFTKHLKNIDVKSLATPKLVPLIEKGQSSSLECKNVLKDYLEYFDDDIPLILGCTHYTLLKEEILKIKKLKLINMGEILSYDINLKETNKSEVLLYFSKVDSILENNVKQIIGNFKIFEKRL